MVEPITIIIVTMATFGGAVALAASSYAVCWLGEHCARWPKASKQAE